MPERVPLEKESSSGIKHTIHLMNERFATDLRSYPEYRLGNYGFSLRRFSSLHGGRFHLLRNWRRSAEALDPRLRRILNLPPPDDSQPEGRDAELWHHNFAVRRAYLGLECARGPCSRHGGLPSVRFPHSNAA